MFRTRTRNRIAILALAGIAAIGVVASACGDDDDGDDGAEPTAAATSAAGDPTAEAEASPTSEAATTPASGGIATIAATDAGELGTILTTIDGYTLYFFANDVAGSGESACVDTCAQVWPPLPVVSEPSGGEGVTGELDTIARADGLNQVTYNGQPLYLFANDASPGDTNGKDIPNWSVAKP